MGNDETENEHGVIAEEEIYGVIETIHSIIHTAVILNGNGFPGGEITIELQYVRHASHKIAEKRFRTSSREVVS